MNIDKVQPKKAPPPALGSGPSTIGVPSRSVAPFMSSLALTRNNIQKQNARAVDTSSTTRPPRPPLNSCALKASLSTTTTRRNGAFIKLPKPLPRTLHVATFYAIDPRFARFYPCGGHYQGNDQSLFGCDMNEAKQMPARSAPQGSTSIASNLGSNANGVVMPAASTSTHFNGGSATTFLSPTKPDMVKMSQPMKGSQGQKQSQFKSLQVISQQSNLSGATGTNCVVLQQVSGGNSGHNLAFASMADNNQSQGSPSMYQQGGQAFMSPPRPVQNASNNPGNQSNDGNHVQMQTQIPVRYTHDGRPVQMIQVNHQYYQVGPGGQPITIQGYVQQPQQQFVRNGVVFASQGNQDGSRILQAVPTQVHIQNTVSPQNTSFHLTKAALKNVKSVNQTPPSSRRSDPQQTPPQVVVATSNSQYATSSHPSSSNAGYEKQSPASSTQVFSPPPAVKPKNRARSTKPKSKASPQQQVVTQTQQVTNNNGQPTATIQQIALPANSQNRNQIMPSNNPLSANDSPTKSSNHSVPMQGASMGSSQQPPEYSNKQQLHTSQATTMPPPPSPSSQSMPPPALPTSQSMAPSALPTSSSKSMPPPSLPNNNAVPQQRVQPQPGRFQYRFEKPPGTANQQPPRRLIPPRRPPPGKQQTVPQTQQVRLQNGQVLQVQHVAAPPTKEQLEAQAMPPPPLPLPKPHLTAQPSAVPVPVPPMIVSPVPSDLDTRWERALNFAFNSNEPKQSFNQMRSHFKKLIYENECYQSQLREYHQRLLKLERDNNYLMDRLLPYENISSSDGEDSDSSTKTIEERVVVQKLTKKRPANRASGSGPPKKKNAVAKPTAPTTNGVAPSAPAPAPKPKAPAAAVSAPSKAVPASSQASAVAVSQGPAKTTPIKFPPPPRNAPRLPTAPALTKSIASVVSPLKTGLSNNPAMKQQTSRNLPNIIRHGQPLLTSLIKGGTSQPSQQSITITSPLAKASLTIPSSPLVKNSVTIPPPRGPVAVMPRFPRPEGQTGASGSQMMPPPSGLPRKLVFEKPTAPTPVRSGTNTSGSSASGSGDTVFAAPLPKNYNNGATAAAAKKSTPAKAKVVISELPKSEGVKNPRPYHVQNPNFVRPMAPPESKKYMISNARPITTNPTPLSNATVTYTSLKPTLGSPSKIVVHQQAPPAQKRPSTMPLAVITSMATPAKKPTPEHGVRSPPFAPMSVQMQPQQHLESPQRNTAPMHHTVSASMPEVTRPLPSTERSTPSSSNGP